METMVDALLEQAAYEALGSDWSFARFMLAAGEAFDKVNDNPMSDEDGPSTNMEVF